MTLKGYRWNTGREHTDGTDQDLPEMRQRRLHVQEPEEDRASEGQEAAVETKYRCKACGHEWKVRVAAA